LDTRDKFTEYSHQKFKVTVLQNHCIKWKPWPFRITFTVFMLLVWAMKFFNSRVFGTNKCSLNIILYISMRITESTFVKYNYKTSWITTVKRGKTGQHKIFSTTPVTHKTMNWKVLFRTERPVLRRYKRKEEGKLYHRTVTINNTRFERLQRS
jgi:hypothetical protein